MKKVPQPFTSLFVLLTDEHNKRAKTAILKIVFRANKRTAQLSALYLRAQVIVQTVNGFAMVGKSGGL